MRSIAAGLLLDVLCVLVFVMIGRINHEEGLTTAGVALTSWPFLAALAAGWIASLPWKPWRNPAAITRTGPLIWLVTVGGGMQVRDATGEGTALSFTIVAAVFLAATLLGWRGIALLLRRRRRNSSAPDRTAADTAEV